MLKRPRFLKTHNKKIVNNLLIGTSEKSQKLCIATIVVDCLNNDASWIAIYVKINSNKIITNQFNISKKTTFNTF